MAESLVFDITARDHASGTFAKIGHAAGLLGLAVGALAIKVGRDSVAGYRDHIKVAAITGQVIKTTGGKANVTAGQVESLSDAIERKTGVDGDAVQSGPNLLLTFTGIRNEVGKGNQIFNRATGIVTDMSVALGTDAKSSAIQLGKALNDPVKGVSALQRVGVSFDDQQKKQIKTLVDSGNTLKAQKVILRELGKEFGGTAEAAATPAAKLQASYHRLQDSIGAALIPALDSIETSLTNNVLPPVIALADKYGPKLSKVLADAGPKISQFFSGLKGGKGVGSDVSSIGNSLQKLGPTLKDAASNLPSFSDGVHVASTVVGFLADHLGLLGKAMPLIIAGLVAYAAAQVVSNTVGRNSLLGFGLQIVSTLALAASNRSLATSMLSNAAATTAASGAGSANLVVTVRGTVATIAHAAASKIAAGAAKVWAAGQWLVNAALTANPIGLVIAAIALLVAGMVIAYKKSETFRNIVNGAFHAVQVAIGNVVGAIIDVFHAMFDVWASVIGGIIHTAAVIATKLHLPFADGLNKIDKSFHDTKDKVDNTLSSLATSAKGWGADIANGLAGGISANAYKAVAAAGGMASKVNQISKDTFKSNSPSRFMIDQGKWLAEGLAVGIITNQKKAIAAVQTMTDNVKNKLKGFRDDAAGILSSVGDSIRGVVDVSAFGAAVDTGQKDANGDPIMRTPGVAETASGFASSASAFVTALKEMAAKHLAPSLIAAVAAAGPAGGLQAAQAFAASSSSDIASVNASIGQINSLAGQAGNIVLQTTRVPADIKREEAALAELKGLRADLTGDKVASLKITKGGDLIVEYVNESNRANRRRS